MKVPEFAVYIPAYNSARYIRRALLSVLAQAQVGELEVLVIDRGSTDDTPAIVESVGGPRTRLLRIDKNASFVQCHNLALRSTTASYLIRVEAVDVLLTGALPKILTAFQQSPDIGLVHCYWFDIDEDGNTTRESFRLRQDLLTTWVVPDMDYRKQLLIHDWILGPLYAYRVETLRAIGGFDENLRTWAEYAAILKIADRYRISLVPETLCARRSSNNARPMLSAINHAIGRRRCHRRLVKSGAVSFLKEKPYRNAGSYFQSFLTLLERRPELNALRTMRFWRRSHKISLRRFFSRSLDWLCGTAMLHLWWWPLDPFFRKPLPPLSPDRKIAYYIWNFPVLSQTFVNRELAALTSSGIDVSIIADQPGDLDLADHNAQGLKKKVEYLEPIDVNRLRRYKLSFLKTSPILYFNLFFFVLTRRYRENKNIHDDRYVFSRAVYLAGVLKEKGIDHVHAPWADESALVALVAAKLLRLTYSVQARAHEIHRKTYLYALREKFQNAEFIATNTRYNQNYLQQMLGIRLENKIVLIHNGLDLEKFRVPPTRHIQNPKVRILSVGRLIEQKGFDYLLRACDLLRRKGFDFECEIIGGPELPSYADQFVRLKLLHRELGLQGHVRFSGTQPFAKVLEKYRTADIFVLPCVIAQDGSRDITPNSLIEAMAMRLPVVSTEVTGVPEIVEDGVCGLLVPPRDEQSLADAMAKLFADRALRDRLGSQARLRVEEKFDIRRNVVRYVDLFCRRRTTSDMGPDITGEILSDTKG